MTLLPNFGISYFTHLPRGIQTTYLSLDFCHVFELTTNLSLYLQPFSEFVCMLLVRLPLTWHLLGFWKDPFDTVHGDVWFETGFFHWATPPHFWYRSDVDSIKGFLGDTVLWEFFQWLPERSWPYQSFCASASCPTSTLFQPPHRQQKNLWEWNSRHLWYEIGPLELKLILFWRRK